MKNKKKEKNYGFIDIAVDIFYSIILYSFFGVYPGIGNIPGMILFIFLTVVLLDYWWSERTIEQIPKYKITDIYFYTFIFFIFSQIVNYLNSPTQFILWFMAFIVTDLIFCIVDGLVYEKEKSRAKFLNMFKKAYILLLIIYGFEAYFITSLNVLTAIMIVIPYLVYVLVLIKSKYTEIRAVYVSD